MAGVYCTYLIPMYYIKFVFSPVSNVLLIANKQQIFLYLQFCRIIVIYAGMQLGYILYGSADAIIVFYGISFSLYYLIVLMYCVRTSVNKKSPMNCYCKWWYSYNEAITMPCIACALLQNKEIFFVFWLLLP